MKAVTALLFAFYAASVAFGAEEVKLVKIYTLKDGKIVIAMRSIESSSDGKTTYQITEPDGKKTTFDSTQVAKVDEEPFTIRNADQPAARIFADYLSQKGIAAADLAPQDAQGQADGAASKRNGTTTGASNVEPYTGPNLGMQPDSTDTDSGIHDGGVWWGWYAYWGRGHWGWRGNEWVWNGARARHSDKWSNGNSTIANKGSTSGTYIPWGNGSAYIGTQRNRAGSMGDSGNATNTVNSMTAAQIILGNAGLHYVPSSTSGSSTSSSKGSGYGSCSGMNNSANSSSSPFAYGAGSTRFSSTAQTTPRATPYTQSSIRPTSAESDHATYIPPLTQLSAPHSTQSPAHFGSASSGATHGMSSGTTGVSPNLKR